MLDLLDLGTIDLEPGAGGGILLRVGYTGRLHRKGVPFLSSQYVKG